MQCKFVWHCGWAGVITGVDGRNVSAMWAGGSSSAVGLGAGSAEPMSEGDDETTSEGVQR